MQCCILSFTTKPKKGGSTHYSGPTPRSSPSAWSASSGSTTILESLTAVAFTRAPAGMTFFEMTFTFSPSKSASPLPFISPTAVPVRPANFDSRASRLLSAAVLISTWIAMVIRTSTAVMIGDSMSRAMAMDTMMAPFAFEPALWDLPYQNGRSRCLSTAKITMA